MGADYASVRMGSLASLVMTSAVGWLTAGGALVLLAVVLAVPVWALRKHNRMFPKGWDRTGWQPEPGKARRFETMWTYFSGGRGSG
jgi:hypothetical protein